METCPCCNNQLLSYVRAGSTYWFCRTCWAEMTPLSELEALRHKPSVPVLPRSLPLSPAIEVPSPLLNVRHLTRSLLSEVQADRPLDETRKLHENFPEVA
ncbi:MAG: hypothetical protein B0A82_13730 [Alkalinema sp. CACIAM 70d]|nr:MAG: hypothetical protein B0A82_13730 [Alkalinema sp. CACIAM 70d]